MQNKYKKFLADADKINIEKPSDESGSQSMGAAVVEGLLNEKSRNFSGRMDIVYISRRDIDMNEKNFYQITDIATLKQSIETIGLKQPLIVKKMPTGRYKLLAGERRLTAIDELINEGKWGTDIPCIIQDYDKVNLPLSDELKEMYVLITTNREQRTYTDADIMNEIKELKNIYSALREAGVDSFSVGKDENGNEITKNIKGVKTRELIAEDLGISQGKVGVYEKVDKKASESIKEALKNQGISIMAAATAADMPKEEQDQLVDEYADTGQKIQPQDVESFKNKDKDKSIKEPEVLNFDKIFSDIQKDVKERNWHRAKFNTNKLMRYIEAAKVQLQ